MRDARIALTSAPTAARNVPRATMSSAYHVICAVNVPARICGANIAIDAETVQKSARIAARYVWTVRICDARIAGFAPNV